MPRWLRHRLRGDQPTGAPHPRLRPRDAVQAQVSASHRRLGGPVAPGARGDFELAGPSARRHGDTVTPTTITVELALFGNSITVTTEFVDGLQRERQEVARSAVATGEQVVFIRAGRAATSSSSRSQPVTLVEIVQPHVLGKIVSVNGSQLVVSQQDGLNVAVNIRPRRLMTRSDNEP